MSSTNRGGQRTPADNYPTPAYAVRRLLEEFQHTTIFQRATVLHEPCSGEGAIIDVVETYYPDRKWYATDIREDALNYLEERHPNVETRCMSALDPFPTEWESPKVIITNPPFRIAEEVLHRLLRDHADADIFLLLRVNFIGSVRRQPFMEAYPPDLYVLPNRPSFLGEGQTDSIEYAWFHWGPTPRKRAFGQWKVLPLTPKEERSAARVKEADGGE